MKANSRCTDRAKKARIFRKAAARVAVEKNCGVVRAINPDHCWGQDTPEVAAMREMFCDGTRFWPWTYDGDRNNQRVIALCFMAAMVEAGDA